MITFSKLPKHIFEKESFTQIGVEGFNIYGFLMYYQNFSGEINFTINQLNDFMILPSNYNTKINMVSRSLEGLKILNIIQYTWTKQGLNSNINVKLNEYHGQFTKFQVNDAHLVKKYDDPTLSILYIIVSYTHFEKKYCFMSINTIRDILGISPNKVIETMNVMQEKHLISISKGFNENNKYRRLI